MGGIAAVVASVLSIPAGFIKEVGDELSIINERKKVEAANKDTLSKMSKEDMEEAASLLVAKRRSQGHR